MNGHDNIKSYLLNSLASAQISNVQLDNRQFLTPELFEAGPGLTGVLGSYTFETPKAYGQENFRLLPGENGEWKALTVLAMIWDWKGHVEIKSESGHFEGHTQPWEKVKIKRREAIESDPQVVIGGYLRNDYSTIPILP